MSIGLPKNNFVMMVKRESGLDREGNDFRDVPFGPGIFILHSVKIYVSEEIP